MNDRNFYVSYNDERGGNGRCYVTISTTRQSFSHLTVAAIEAIANSVSKHRNVNSVILTSIIEIEMGE